HINRVGAIVIVVDDVVGHRRILVGRMGDGVAVAVQRPYHGAGHRRAPALVRYDVVEGPRVVEGVVVAVGRERAVAHVDRVDVAGARRVWAPPKKRTPAP